MSHYGLQIFQTTRKPMIVSRVSPNLMGQAVRLMFNPGWIPCVVQSGDASELGLITQWIGWKKNAETPGFSTFLPFENQGFSLNHPRGSPKVLTLANCLGLRAVGL
jgi:hypothetical protein